MDLQESRKLVALIGDLYPGRITDPEVATGYQIMLDDVPYAAVMAVFKSICMSTPDHPPTAPYIAKYMTTLIRPTIDPATAWEKTLKAGNRCAANDPQCAYRYVDNPEIEHAIRAVGWERIATTDYKHHGTLFAQFRSAYESGIQGGTVQETRNMLANMTSAAALGEAYPVRELDWSGESDDADEVDYWR